VQLSETTENPTTYTENLHCYGKVHTTCGKLHNCGKFNNIYRELCHCIALHTSTMAHGTFILKGMEFSFGTYHFSINPPLHQAQIEL
jgi:hypothetical protein